jgi:serine/threonine protein kinase
MDDKLIIASGVYGKICNSLEDKNKVIKIMKKYNYNNDNHEIKLCRQNLQELVFLAQFSHPNIITCDKITILDSNYNLYLEKCDMCLFDYIINYPFIERYNNLPYILFQITNGLSYLHKKNLIHGDLKPENILINKDNLQIKIIDYGGIMSFRHYDNFENICTREYSPPEAWAKLNTHDFSTPKFDMWSLGMIIYFYLTRKYFFDFDEDIYIDNKFISEFQKLMKYHNNLPIRNNLIDIFKKNKIKLDLELLNIIENLLIFNRENRLSSSELLNYKYFDKIRSNIPKASKLYKSINYFSFLLNKNNKFRLLAIDKLYDLSLEYSIPQVFSLCVLLLDKYLMICHKLLATYNYKYILFSIFILVATLITKKNIYFSDYKKITKNYNLEKIKYFIDNILETLNFKLYYETFDWFLFRKKTKIDYSIIYDIIKNFDYNQKKNSELLTLYYLLKNIKNKKTKK